MRSMRHLIIVLGDQLDSRSAAFDGFDRREDAVWMAEVAGEAQHVPSHKARIALFLSAMRHFRMSLEDEGITVYYRKLEDPGNRGTLGRELEETAVRFKPRRLIVVEPGEWRVREEIKEAAKRAGIDLEIREDHHFVASHEDFESFARGKKQLRMEFFYRSMRRKMGILMEGNAPEGGKWNYDTENRKGFEKKGPGQIPVPVSFPPDEITREVLEIVGKFFAGHPGSLRHFDWPVTRQQAAEALQDFAANRLSLFGPYQDAMWAGHPYLYHSRLASSMNLKLLAPREAVRAAEEAYRKRRAALNCVEGFIRQIIGWREYVRGVYWHFMPDYLSMNAMDADLPLPRLYWTAETEMNCLREAVSQTLEYGYAHHIQRLMVTGLFALLLGVNPREVHEWYLAIYVDAVEWVELPNTLGMSQFADGGIMASKPYVATGKYIDRMSNYCGSCRYDPDKRQSEKACPFTVLYWDFLIRHRKRIGRNPRMGLQMKNADRLGTTEQRNIRRHADAIRRSIDYHYAVKGPGS